MARIRTAEVQIILTLDELTHLLKRMQECRSTGSSVILQVWSDGQVSIQRLDAQAPVEQ